MLRGEDWIGYSGKDVLVNCGNNRRVVRRQLLYRLDPYVVCRQNLGDEEVYQVRQPTRVRRTVRRFAGAVVGAVVSRGIREKSAALGRGKTRAPSVVLRIRLHRPEIADPGIGKRQRSQLRCLFPIPESAVSGRWRLECEAHRLGGARLTTPKGSTLFSAISGNNCTHYSTGEPTYWPTEPRKLPDLIDFFVARVMAADHVG